MYIINHSGSILILNSRLPQKPEVPQYCKYHFAICLKKVDNEVAYSTIKIEYLQIFYRINNKMEPLKRITINFQQIFKDDSKIHPDVQNSFTHSSSHPISLNDQADSILQDTKAIQLHQIIPQKNNSPSIQLKNENQEQRQIPNSKNTTKKQLLVKKIEQGDSSKITAKLYHHKTSVCSKSHQKYPQSDQEQTPQRNIKKIKNENRSSIKNESGVHERLYNMSRSQILKQIYFPTESQKSKSKPKKLTTVKSSKYLKNYVPLEKRVEEYIAQGDNISNKSMISKSSEKDFRPQLIRNKYTDKVQSRYNKQQIKQLRASQIAQFLNSSVSSSFSNQSRSAQIMRRIEQHFLQKVRLIFVKQDNAIQISEQSISLLTDVQFHILQPFIMQMEQSNHLEISNFQQQFRIFYNSLQFSEKMSLRNHEAKIKSKYLQLKQEVKQKKKQSIKIQPKKSKILASEAALKKTNGKKSDYHLSFQQFI